MQRYFLLLAVLAGIGCKPKFAGARAARENGRDPVMLVRGDSCAPVTQNAIDASIRPRNLAGEYLVTLVGQTPAQIVWHQRLWLWPTSMHDVSPRTGARPEPNDTAIHPLYGFSMMDSGPISPQRLQKLRKATDPIYPEILLEAEQPSGTVSTKLDRMVLLTNGAGRRDGVDLEDGGGTGMSLKRLDSTGFRGHFEPWGGQVDEKGYYCAQRIQ